VPPDGYPDAGQPIPLTGFVIPDPAVTILFDTGFSPFEDDVRERYHPRYRPAREALTESGVDPESITAIVNCHMHSDHAGGNHEFPGVTIYVSRSNWTTRARPTSPTRSTRATSRARRSR